MNEMIRKQNGFSLVTLSILVVGLLTIGGLLRLARWRLILLKVSKEERTCLTMELRIYGI
jgi:hypothetical protein